MIKIPASQVLTHFSQALGEYPGHEANNPSALSFQVTGGESWPGTSGAFMNESIHGWASCHLCFLIDLKL